MIPCCMVELVLTATSNNFGSVPYRNEEIMVPQLDNRKLIALGWEIKVGIKEGISKILKEY